MRARGQSASDDCVEVGGPAAVRGLWFGRRPRGVAQHTGAFVWLAFIAFPAVNAFTRHGTTLDHTLTITAAIAFVVAYIALIVIWRRRYADPVLAVLFLVLVGISSALTLGDGGGWGFLFTYCAACAGLISPNFGFAGVILCSVLAGVTSAVGGASGGNSVGWVASSAGIGFLLLVMRDLRIRNDQLSEARAELARLAVAEERERFARDLHDLLGHSLSLIALKSELARRLLPERPDDAAHELGDVEAVARSALTEVREAVSGYRRPTLDGELQGARVALAAANIRVSVDRTDTPLAPEVEAVLAWTVREGVTNVIRHSNARSCSLRVAATEGEARIEVTDDGLGAAAVAAIDPNGRDGSGLAGLEQRARSLGGTLQGGSLPSGGFRLAVAVPMLTEPVVAADTDARAATPSGSAR